MKWSIQTKLILITSASFTLLILVLSSGALDSIAEDGKVDRIVIGSLVIYWLLGCSGAILAINLRRKWKELVLSLFSTLVTLAIAELGLRYLGSPAAMSDFRGVSSREYHHIYPKNRKMNAGIYEGKTVTVKTNEDGLRSTYSRSEFRKYKKRIVILGDSFTFGKGVRQEFTFPEVTEKLLRERLKQDDIAILNAGIISFSPLLEDLLFSGIVKSYEPTLVLLFLDATDIGDDVKYSKEMKKEGNRVHFELEAKDEEILSYGVLYQLSYPYLQKAIQSLRYPYDLVSRVISKHVQGAVGPVIDPSDSIRRSMPKEEKYDYYDFTLDIDGTVEHNRFFIYRHPLESTKQYFLSTLANINDVATKVSESGARFVLVITPRFHHWNPRECPNNWEKGQYSLDEPYQYEYFRFFEEMKVQLKYEVFSLLPAFQETKDFPLVFEDDPHWNERGHAFVAKTIADYLIENQLLQ